MIYLDNAATSRFKPRTVIESAYRAFQNGVNTNRTTYSASAKEMRTVFSTREAILDYFGAENKTVAFSSGCTESLNLAILGADYPVGANVVTTVYEHNSVLRPLFELQKRGIIEVRIAEPNENGQITAKSVEELTDDKTRMVIINAVSNVTGTMAPVYEIGEMCKRRNIDYVLDGAQAAGHIKIDMDACFVTAMACPGHKGLNGLQGVGFLIFDPDRAPSPIRFGGTGSDSLNTLQPTTLPEGLESGTQNTPGIISLYHAIEWHIMNDKRVFEKIERLNALLTNEIKKVDGIRILNAENHGITCFAPSAPSNLFCDMLYKKGVIARCGYHCAPLAHKYLDTLKTGAVRLSVGFDNTESEMYAAARAVSDVAKMIKGSF